MESNCTNHDMVYVKRRKSNGQPLLNKQCLTCGEHDAKAYKLADVKDFESLPEYSETLVYKYYDTRRQAVLLNREQEKQEWFKNHYNPYLNSDEWQDKRRKVLNRDGFLCQSCLINEAVQVHHLTYAHVFNEPLFELTSVCNPCHELITKLDNTK